MDGNVKVSVISPLYNSERYIQDFVLRFLKQTLDDIELIFVDDASPDNSFDRAKHYMELYPETIRVYHYDKNRGAGGARNFGLSKANGQFVCFVDPDDWMDETMLYKLYSIAMNENCDVVDCDYYDYVENKQIFIKQTSLQNDCVGIVDEQIIDRLAFNPGRVFTKIFDRNMLISNALCYPENIRFEDNGVNFCICAKRIGKVQEHLFYYRTSSNTSQTGIMLKKDYVLDRVRAAEYLVSQFIRLNKFDVAFNGLEYRFIYLGYASNIYSYIVAEYDINFETLKYAKDLAYKYFDNFKNNTYYKKNMPMAYKLSILVYELNPYLISIYKKLRPLFRLRYKIVKFFKGNNE